MKYIRLLKMWNSLKDETGSLNNQNYSSVNSSEEINHW